MPIRVSASAAIVRDGQVLLIEFSDESGLHYNLPGGGVDEGESIMDAVRREAMEEACADVEVGPLLLVWEYESRRHAFRYGLTHKACLVFSCRLRPGSEPRLPPNPDPNQTRVCWVPLDELSGVALLPASVAEIAKLLESSSRGAVFTTEM